MSSKAQAGAALLGRIFLAAIFLMSGFGKLAAPKNTLAYMENANVPLAQAALVLAVAFELAGGLSVLLGAWARAGAVLLLVFLALATAYFHAFWAFPEDQVRMQTIQFMKNLAIAGGLLLLLAHGPGPLSLTGRKRTRGAPPPPSPDTLPPAQEHADPA